MNIEYVNSCTLVALPCTNDLQADIAFGASHGCQPPPELPYRWPLGIDRIKELWGSNSEGRLLALICSIAKDYEPRNNLSQFLLIGPRAFHVLHPKNVGAILSTNFKGIFLHIIFGSWKITEDKYRLRLWSSLQCVFPSSRQRNLYARGRGLEAFKRTFTKTVCSITVPKSRPFSGTRGPPYSTFAHQRRGNRLATALL